MAVRKWDVWRFMGNYGVWGPDTNGKRIPVIEAEPTVTLIRQIEHEMKTHNQGLMGFDFWSRLNELIKLHKDE